MAYLDRYGNVKRDLWDTVQEQYYGIQPEVQQPTQPEGFFYPEPTGEGIQYPADQPVEPRTVESTPDYYGNTMQIDAFPDGVNPAREGGIQKFTNLPGRGGGYEFRPEAPVEAPVPGGFLPDTYGLQDPKGDPLVTDPESYIRERGVQEREAEGIQRASDIEQAQALKFGDKLSFEEQQALQEQEDMGAVRLLRMESWLETIGELRTRLLEYGTDKKYKEERKSIRAEITRVNKLIDSAGRRGPAVKKGDPLAKLRRELQKTLTGRTRLTRSNRTPEFIPEARDPRDLPPPGEASGLEGPFIGRYGGDLFDPRRDRPSIFSLRGRESF